LKRCAVVEKIFIFFIFFENPIYLQSVVVHSQWRSLHEVRKSQTFLQKRTIGSNLSHLNPLLVNLVYQYYCRIYTYSPNVIYFLQILPKAFYVQFVILLCSFNNNNIIIVIDRLCGLVGRVLGYRSGGPGSIPGTTRKKK
jgi:hypothetical protein